MTVETNAAAPPAGDAEALAVAIAKLSRTSGKEIDRLKLFAALSSKADALSVPALSPKEWRSLFNSVAADLGEETEWFVSPDPARLPCLTYLPGRGWGILLGMLPNGDYVFDASDEQSKISHEGAEIPCVRFAKEVVAIDTNSPVFQLFKKEFFACKRQLKEGVFAGIILNLIALGTSVYSMQVYDRVVPTQGFSTLMVLTIGMAIALFFDLMIKISRSHILEEVIKTMDSRMSRAMFGRLLEIRLDQMPGSVGSLSSQLRSYESIRSFLSTTTFYAFVDVPFAFLYIVFILMIGGLAVGLVPLVFLVLSLIIAFYLQKKQDAYAHIGMMASNQKTGLLVESIEGAETIKSTAAGWSFLSKWIDLNKKSIESDMSMKSISDTGGYITSLLSQASYVIMVAVGATYAAEGHMTTGALIACTIISGRISAPIAALPGMGVQFSHAKVALRSLERLFAYEVDNYGIDRPLLPEHVAGGYELKDVKYAYVESVNALTLPMLRILPGQKIGVIGPVGSGKSTLLRLLSGMYRPTEGRVMLDGLDIAHIAPGVLAQAIGFLQQEHRLFSGTLRENLIVGCNDPGDEKIKEACAATGLLESISAHPKGLSLMIQEGGKGLSGGQRQLVALTRLMIGSPKIWLLDEPTASMDDQREVQCVELLKRRIDKDCTLVLVTHKMNLLQLVDRVLVVVGHGLVMDGPRDEVLKKLSGG